MRRRSSALAALAALLAAALPVLAAAQELKTEEDKTSYALGVMAGRGFADLQLTPHELELMLKGLSDALTPGKKAAVELNAYQEKIQEFAHARMAKAGDARKEVGKAFAEKAATEKGAEKTASGLVIIPIKPGKGASPTADDTVKVHYAGRLIDGTEFDSSYARNEPAEFPLRGVIPCWTEGLAKMKVGGKSKLICPADIAYGPQGRAPKIPGNATLVFEVELLEIVKKAEK
jgi:FKBP-type peptidyl-prolyl cis-trans isomerase